MTGGTGKISSRIAPLLSAHGDTTLVASRAGTTPLLQRCQGIKFDWLDPATYSTLFEYGPISAVFLVAPPIMDCLSPMKEFIDLAVQKGARRFVLLSASVVDSGDGPMIEKISKYITTIGVDYAILQPTWFMENFSEMQHFHTIRDENRIVTATGEGKVPFVSADDIAAIAFRALTDEVPHNTNHLILGSELWSYDEVGYLFRAIQEISDSSPGCNSIDPETEPPDHTCEYHGSGNGSCYERLHVEGICNNISTARYCSQEREGKQNKQYC